MKNKKIIMVGLNRNTKITKSLYSSPYYFGEIEEQKKHKKKLKKK